MHDKRTYLYGTLAIVALCVCVVALKDCNTDTSFAHLTNLQSLVAPRTLTITTNPMLIHNGIMKRVKLQYPHRNTHKTHFPARTQRLSLRPALSLHANENKSVVVANIDMHNSRASGALKVDSKQAEKFSTGSEIAGVRTTALLAVMIAYIAYVVRKHWGQNVETQVLGSQSKPHKVQQSVGVEDMRTTQNIFTNSLETVQLLTNRKQYRTFAALSTFSDPVFRDGASHNLLVYSNFVLFAYICVFLFIFFS